MAAMNDNHNGELLSPPQTSSSEGTKALLVFSPELASELANKRFAPTYVGVRRVRPDDDAIEHQRRKSSIFSVQPSNTAIVYKITNEFGVERRMTAQEKKELKSKLKKEQATERKKRKLDQILLSHQQQRNSEDDADDTISTKTTKPTPEDELQNVRDGTPPVLLSPCMALEVRRRLEQTRNTPNVRMDGKSALDWCAALRSSIEVAEEMRQKEDLRPMVYRMIPEVWTRMRPGSLISLDDTENDHKSSICSLLKSAKCGSAPSSDILWPPMRVSLESFDSDMDVVYFLLHRYSTLNISCGAKFGCDLLLYDGPRHKRHAFAGLRVYSPDCEPTAYELAAYARCLHTAGKLALVATVVRHGGECGVAFVDLVLEKIANTTSAKVPIGRRRDVGKNLSKA